MPQNSEKLGRKGMAIDKWQQHLLQSTSFPTQMNLLASQIKFTSKRHRISRMMVDHYFRENLEQIMGQTAPLFAAVGVEVLTDIHCLPSHLSFFFFCCPPFKVVLI